MAILNIDFSQVEATSVLEPLPTGWYRGAMVESEIKPTSNAATTGNELISTKFQLLDPAFKNRPVFKNFNYKNQNEQAQTIGWGEMKALNEALNLVQVPDTNVWHNQPVLLYIKLKPARKQLVDKNDESKGYTEYDAQNDVTGFKNINDTSVDIITEPPRKGTGQVGQPMGGAPYQHPTSFVNGQSPVTAVGQPWNPATQQPAQAPVVAASAPVAQQQTAMPAFAPVAQAPAPAPAPAPEPVIPTYEMTAAAGGATMQMFIDKGWTIPAMLEKGYCVEVKPAAPVAPVAPQPAQAPAPAASGAATPPWLANK